MDNITVKAQAKINLTLDVLNKREDGYHNVKMIMHTIELCDFLSLQKTQGDINVKTNLVYLPTDSRNIAYKAAKAFFEHCGINNGVNINIEKHIPVSAGLAGGSTNAAAVLKGLNIMYDNPLQQTELLQIGKGLGADVPYCILGGTMLAEGIGDILTPLSPLPKAHIVLAKPSFSVSTASVYAKIDTEKINYHPDTEGMILSLKKGSLLDVSVRMYNVMEQITSRRRPIIKRIKSIMIENGALGAVMSGSGPTVFGIFNAKQAALKTAARLKKLVNEVYVV